MIVFPSISFVEAFWFFVGDVRSLTRAVDGCYIRGGVDRVFDEFFCPLEKDQVEICVVDISDAEESEEYVWGDVLKNVELEFVSFPIPELLRTQPTIGTRRISP